MTGTETACYRETKCSLVRVEPARAGEEDFDPTMAATWTEDAFRQVDRNRDGRITSSEWFYNAEYFRRADRNRDGALTLAEFTSTSMDDDRDDRFDNLDVNRNGRVEKGEWHGSLDAFEWLDRNRDNVLTRAEVVGETSNQSNQFDSFASLDTNRSGTLTPDEWKWTTRSFAATTPTATDCSPVVSSTPAAVFPPPRGEGLGPASW